MLIPFQAYESTFATLIGIAITGILIQDELSIGTSVDVKFVCDISILIDKLHRFRQRNDGSRSHEHWNALERRIRYNHLPATPQSVIPEVEPLRARRQIDLASSYNTTDRPR